MPVPAKIAFGKQWNQRNNYEIDNAHKYVRRYEIVPGIKKSSKEIGKRYTKCISCPCHQQEQVIGRDVLAVNKKKGAGYAE